MTDLARLRGEYAAFTLPELSARVNANPQQYIVDSFLPEQTVNLMVGDSALGKTPFAYQLGLCVAAGAPFLGRPTQQGRVLYVDLENGERNIDIMQQSICKALSLSVPPDNFIVLTAQSKWEKIHQALRDFRPLLTIIDTLRAFKAGSTERNDDAADTMQNLRKIGGKEKAGFFVLHHIRKRPTDARQVPPVLEETPVMEWLEQASGARALINQSDVRIGIDRPRAVINGVGLIDEIALVIKGHEKVRGEFGPIYLSRLLDPNTLEPVAYRVVSAIDLLDDSRQIAAFHRLPSPFTIQDAIRLYGHSPEYTRQFLKKCLAIGLIARIGNPHSPAVSYRKLQPSSPTAPQITCT